MGFFKEFKEFAVKGNVMDLAVGVIIGAAFGKIVDSVVKDLIMPVVSAIIGSPDFTNMYVVLKDPTNGVREGMALAEAQAVENVVILSYGNFITVAINFILLAFAIFLMVKGVNKLKRKEVEVEAPAAPAGPTQEELLAEIRDLLKNK
ncbi:large conductance mechanosensitive channel protein MscL [Capnocytophaga canimorsus]|uniref:large conductance mechanosensitive channel protein MscL n=1 Tax=Capnocytophaga canimorsus TaxID=28188 RepID=UPI001AC333F8|nr:large conductance mechanosensitive channel protein MscL [Capnocytophaga canimorsus]GIM56675.1 large-conductance mechanosensitive channel [Capnocytophaga canimorsus]GJQ05509.1 large-conductance mechanosensitive channel [Capnocytophaga canimorsus]